MKIMILFIICWVVADVAAIAIRNFEDKSDAAMVPGSFTGKVIYIFLKTRQIIILSFWTLYCLRN